MAYGFAVKCALPFHATGGNRVLWRRHVCSNYIFIVDFLKHLTSNLVAHVYDTSTPIPIEAPERSADVYVAHGAQLEIFFSL